MVKKILIFIAVLFVLFIGALVAVPIIFKDQIFDLVQKEMNKQVDAKIYIEDFDLSLIRSFPDLSLILEEVTVKNNKPFEGVELAVIQKAAINMDVMSALKGESVNINSFELVAPKLQVIINKDGKANYDIMKAPKEPTIIESEKESSDFSINVNSYSIEDGELMYVDEAGNMSLFIEGLTHSGSGDFSAEEFVLKTKTDLKSLSFAQDNEVLLNHVKVKADVDVEANMKDMQFNISKNDIMLNALALNLEGQIELPNEKDIDMNLEFSAPSTDFKQVLSLIPAAYTEDFDRVKAKGKFKLDGFLSGTYNDKTIPSFGVNLNVNKAMFQYPDLPNPIEDIQATVKVLNSTGNLSETLITIPKLSLKLGSNLFKLKGQIKDPINDPNVDIEAEGKIDLEYLINAFPLEGVEQMKGLLVFDVKAKGKSSDFEAANLGRVSMSGNLTASDLLLKSVDLPNKLELTTADLKFSPKQANVSNLKMKIGSSTIKGNGYLDNLFAYALSDELLSGKLNIQMDKFIVDEWMPEEEEIEAASDETPISEVALVPANFNLDMSSRINSVVYDKIEIKNVFGEIGVKDQKLILKNLKGETLGGKLLLNGVYDTKELIGGKPSFDFSYDMQNIDIKTAFNSVNTVKKIAPIAQFIEGKFSTNIVLKGLLGDDMFPDLTSISGDGFVGVFKGILKDFKPLTALSDKLKIGKLHTVKLDDIKNNIKIADGKVSLEPFNYSVEGIDMKIGGSHGFDSDMDYNIKLKVPKEELGGQVSGIVNDYAGQVAALGINPDILNFINFNVNVTGTMDQPKFKIALDKPGSEEDGVKDMIKDVVEEKKEEIKEEVKEQVDSIKNEIKEKVEEKKEEIKEEVKEAIEEKKEEVKEEIKDKIKGLFGGGKP